MDWHDFAGVLLGFCYIKSLRLGLEDFEASEPVMPKLKYYFLAIVKHFSSFYHSIPQNELIQRGRDALRLLHAESTIEGA